ncbi:MAG: acetoacetate decarboxylase family protein [Deltaproteobacteria bacterium]|nr:acetoacetate decarboxylase family protein [Deltaproteobacteria bacterium]
MIGKNKIILAVALICISLIFAGASFAQEPAFKSSGKGKLTAEQINAHPIMPWWMPATPESQPYKYRNIDMVAVAFATDQDKAAALVPDELDLLALPGMPGQSAASLIFAKYRENDQTGPYTEAIVTIPVLAKGMPFLYVAAIYVDTDAALIAGREFGGYPKKIAKITMYNYGNLFLSRLCRATAQEKTADPQFYDIASSNVTKGGRLFSVPLRTKKIKQLPFPYNMLLPLPKATGKPQPYVLPTIGLRTIPGVGKASGHAEVQQLIGTPWIITRAEVYAGLNPSIDLIPSIEDPIAQKLPINMVLGAFILRGDMHTDPGQWLLLKDYKK